MRIRPSSRVLTLEAERAELEARIDLSGLQSPSFAVDIYSQIRVHPDRHLGWWRYRMGGDRLQLELRLDLTSRTDLSVSVSCNGRSAPLESCWVNQDYRMEPAQDLQLVIRDGNDKIVEVAHISLKDTRPETLKKYAEFVHRSQGYVPPGMPHTFTNVFHANRLRRLSGLFDKYVQPGSRVLDVASGHGLFMEPLLRERLKSHWRFRLTCCDIVQYLMAERAREFPEHRWLVSEAGNLPFEDGAFDAALAGEIIEHVPDGYQTLREWRRVLRDNGILVVTTPNRARLLNRWNRLELPLGPDHINELTYRELGRLLQQAGFAVLESKGLYLEAIANWHNRGNAVDHMQTYWNWPRFARLMEVLMAAGKPVPGLAWNLMFVARKT